MSRELLHRENSQVPVTVTDEEAVQKLADIRSRMQALSQQQKQQEQQGQQSRELELARKRLLTEYYQATGPAKVSGVQGLDQFQVQGS